MSRLAADTTQVKSAVGATASVALRNVILGLGAVAMMVVTSPKLSGLVIAAIPVIVLPLVAFGRSVRRKSRLAQDTLADATAYASEQIGAVRTLQAFTNEKLVTGRFSRRGGSRVRGGAGFGVRALLPHLLRHLHDLFLGGGGAVVRLARRACGTLSPGTLGQFLLYSVFAAGALGALSEVWGELAQAAGAAERLTEILAEKPAIQRRPIRSRCRRRRKARSHSTTCRFSYPARPDRAAVHGLSFQVKPGETVAIVGPSGAGKSTVFSLILRFYDPETGSDRHRRRRSARGRSCAIVRARIAIVPQDVDHLRGQRARQYRLRPARRQRRRDRGGGQGRACRRVHRRMLDRATTARSASAA